MKINIKKLVPKEWTIEKLNNNKIKVYYINKGRGSSPKPFILPQTIFVDKEFIEAIAMYLGDGKLSADDKHLGFTSIDSDMVKFVLDFFVKRFNVSLKDFTVSINCKEFKKEILNRWAKALDIPSSKFRIQTTLRSRNPSCDLQLSGKVFRIIFEKILNEITSSDFLLNQQLRRAFLRGLFAAEGNIAVNYKQNYIVCVQYCLGSHEKDLSSLIKKALDIEGITYNESIKKSDKSWTIVITNWKNYLKCWKIDLFYKNARKEYLFLNKLRITKFSCKIDSNLKDKLLNIKHFSHRQLAFFIGANPAMFCKVLKNKADYINIEYIIKLSKIASIPLDDIKTNIIKFTVNDVTLINDKEFIDFIFDLKSYLV